MNLVAYTISCLIFFILSIPIHELGHLLFGKLTGYEFSSFTLFKYTWVKQDSKIIFKNSGVGFIVGQCLMKPPEDESKFKFVLYNLGGGFANIIISIVSILGMILWHDNEIIFSILFGCVIMNLMQGLLNLIPMNIKIPNDGMNVVTALKSKQATHGFYVMLTMSDETMNGKRYREFLEDRFAITEDADYNNFFIAYLVLCKASRLYDLGKYDECIETYQVLDLDKLQEYYRNSVKVDLLYHYIIHKPDYTKAKTLFNEASMKKFLQVKMPSITRVNSAYTFFVEKNHEKGMKQLEQAKQQAEQFPNKGISIMELDYLSNLETVMYASLNEIEEAN